MYPVIVCIAKKEHDYIIEFVKYHLNLGFKHMIVFYLIIYNILLLHIYHLITIKNLYNTWH